ncbi:response regulator [Flavicella sediminum]|uniref:response regulator n=1 Tax=Flavicella sediminum TaxID=2585141 RepID=UPI001122575E|nr:response regulator transcription factor [Flavicella sediminum]
MKPIRLLIADDHPLIAEGIKNTFTSNAFIEVVSVVTNGEEAIDFLKKEVVDIALLDIEMPKMNGLACAKEILANYQPVKVIMLSMYQEASLIKELIEIGVKGYMLKTIAKDELILAIQKVHGGQEYFSSDVTKALLLNKNSEKVIQFNEKSKLLELLTKREIEIIGFIAEGLTNIQIGEKLFISPRTVDSHRTNLMKKLDLHNVAGLIRFAFQNGLS